MQTFATLKRFTHSLGSFFSASYHATQKPFLNITEKQLADTHFMNQVLKTNIPKHSKRSQRNIFHGKETKTGNRYTEMGNARRRTWKPNAVRKSMYSEILCKKMDIQVTTKALKCIRKYGGFDNYILLTKPKKMDSLFGEYLRKLMMNKLENPQMITPYLPKTQKFNGISSRWKYRFRRTPVVFHPKDQRYTDMTQKQVRRPHEMTKEELRMFKEFDTLDSSNQDIETSHPLMRQIEEHRAQQMALLEPDRLKALASWDRKTSKRKKELVEAVWREAEEEEQF